jgi:hypothetical protein
MSDLLERYLDYVRNDYDSYNVRRENKQNLKNLKSNMRKVQTNVTKDYDVVKQEIEKLLSDKIKELGEQENKLKDSLSKIPEIIQFLNDADNKMIYPVTGAYPIGYGIDNRFNENLYSKMSEYLDGMNENDINNCVKILNYVFEGELLYFKYFDEIAKISNKDITNKLNFNKPTELHKVKDLFLKPAYRSVFHWPTYNPMQLGIGGPSDFADIFYKLFLKDQTDAFKIVINSSYLYPQLMVTAGLTSTANKSIDKKFDDFKQLLRRKHVNLKLGNVLYLDHNIWFTNNDVVDVKSDSYVTYQSLGKLYQHNTPARGTAGGAAGAPVPFDDTTNGLYKITNGHYIAARENTNPNDQYHFFIFAKYGKWNKEPTKFDSNATKKIVYNVCQDVPPITDASFNFLGDTNHQFNAYLYPDPSYGHLKPLVSGMSTYLHGSTAVNKQEYTASSIVTSGGKPKKMRGGGGWFPPIREESAKQIVAELSGTTCGNTDDLNLFTEKFAIFGDREFMNKKDYKNLFKLYDEIIKEPDDKLNKILERYGDNVYDNSGTAGVIPTFYAYDKVEDRQGKMVNQLTRGKEFLTMKELGYVFAIGNLGVNIGTMLKKMLNVIVVQYYNANELVKDELKDKKNRNNKKYELRKMDALQNKLMDQLINKYYTIIKVIDEIFGRVPTINDKETLINDSYFITEAEYFSGVTFTLPEQHAYFYYIWLNQMKNLIEIIRKSFPIIYDKGTRGEPTSLNERKCKERLVKLLYKLPDYYVKRFEAATAAAGAGSVTDFCSVDLGTSNRLEKARQELTLGGLPLLDPSMDDMKNYIFSLRLSLDSAKRSKETYKKEATFLQEKVRATIQPGERLAIAKGVKQEFDKIKGALLKYRKYMPKDLDNDQEFFKSDKSLQEVYQKLIRKILIDFCGKKDNFLKEYVRNVQGTVTNTESRVGNLATSIYTLKRNANINKKGLTSIDKQRQKIITEAKNVILNLYEGYVEGIYPQIVVRYTAQKIHNIIFDMENYGLRILGMNMVDRRSHLRLLGYSGRQDLTSFQTCITTNLKPNNFNTTDFWKKKEAIFNKLTSMLHKGRVKYHRIYCVLIQEQIEETTQDQKKWRANWWQKAWGYTKTEDGRWKKVKTGKTEMWLVDVLSLAVKENFNELDEDTYEKIKLNASGDLDDKARAFLNHTLDQQQPQPQPQQPTRTIYLGESIMRDFNIEQITEKKVVASNVYPLILISNYFNTQLFLKGIKEGIPQMLKTNKVIHILTNNKGETLEVHSELRNQIYDLLFYLPEVLIPNMTNKLNEGTILEMNKLNGEYLSNKKGKNAPMQKSIYKQEKVNQYAAKVIGRLNNFNPFLVNMVTDGPLKKPYPYNFLGMSSEKYEQEIIKQYKLLGCKQLPPPPQPPQPCIEIIKDAIDIGTKLGTNKLAQKAVGVTRIAATDKINLVYYKINDKNTNKALSYIVDEANIQKGFGWLEDIESVSEIETEKNKMNIF